MTTTVQTKLKIESWDEQPSRELEDGRKFTRAEVRFAGDQSGSDGSGGENRIESATYSGLMYYAADGTSTYVTMMQVTATLDGKSGSFVLTGSGTYDGTTAAGESSIVPGSGTGELAGISGSASSSSTHDDYPYMPLTISYDLG